MTELVGYMYVSDLECYLLCRTSHKMYPMQFFSGIINIQKHSYILMKFESQGQKFSGVANTRTEELSLRRTQISSCGPSLYSTAGRALPRSPSLRLSVASRSVKSELSGRLRVEGPST
jgi:hypothetical protein